MPIIMDIISIIFVSLICIYLLVRFICDQMENDRDENRTKAFFRAVGVVFLIILYFASGLFVIIPYIVQLPGIIAAVIAFMIYKCIKKRKAMGFDDKYLMFFVIYAAVKFVILLIVLLFYDGTLADFWSDGLIFLP